MLLHKFIKISFFFNFFHRNDGPKKREELNRKLGKTNNRKMENVEILGDLYLFLGEDLNGTRRKMAIKGK